MAEILSLAAFGVSIFALISEIITVYVDTWVYKEEIIEYYNGLWSSCYVLFVIPTCSSIEATDELRAVQAMVLCGLSCNVVALICAALKRLVMKEQKLLSYAVTGLLVATGVFMMIGFAVYVGTIYPFHKSNGYDLATGFSCCVMSWLVAWVAAALFGLVAKKEN